MKEQGIKKIIQHRGEAEASSVPQTLDRLYDKGKKNCYILTALPLPQANTIPCREVSFEPLFPPVTKENPGV